MYYYITHIQLVSIYPREMKGYIYTKGYILMFIASLFEIAQMWK